MKKKGFTLVEVVAVMAIVSVIMLSIGEIYVTGIKRTQDTKINNDIESEYRNTYQLTKNQIQDSDNVLGLKLNKDARSLGKKFSINKITKELQGFKEDKAYILAEDNKTNIDTILATFKKNSSDELSLYILYVDSSNIDENEIKQKDMFELQNISIVREVCDNLKEISIDETENGFNFKLDYLKDKLERNYEYYISKDANSLTINSVPEKLVEFYDNIASLTVLNPENNKSIKLQDASIELSSIKNNNPSFFIKDILNSDDDKVNSVNQFVNAVEKVGDNNKCSILSLRNNNKGSDKFKPLSLKFSKADKNIIITGDTDYKKGEIDLREIVGKLRKGDFVLINKNNKIQVDKNNEMDIKNIDNENIDDFKNYVGAIMNIGDNKCTILVNGDLTIKSLKQNKLIFKDHKDDKKSIDGMLIYSTGSLNIEGDTRVERTSFVVNDGINITGNLDIKGQYTLTGEKRNLISTFLNND